MVNGGLLVAWPAFEQPSPVVGSIAVVPQVAATAALLWWLCPVPVETLAAAPTTRRVALAVAIGLAVLALFPLGAAGSIVLVPVGVAAVVVLVVLRRVGSQRELIAAATFGALAAAGGLVEATTGAIGVGAAWAQLPLVAVTLLAG